MSGFPAIAENVAEYSQGHPRTVQSRNRKHNSLFSQRGLWAALK